MIVIDSNVLLDVIVGGGEQAKWSRRMLSSERDGLLVPMVVLAETARRFTSPEEQVGYVAKLGAKLVEMSPQAAFGAGRAFAEYRRRGGERAAILADFLIGGHAAALGAALMTRDRGRFAGYFPDLTLITPETHP